MTKELQCRLETSYPKQFFSQKSNDLRGNADLLSPSPKEFYCPGRARSPTQQSNRALRRPEVDQWLEPKGSKGSTELAVAAFECKPSGAFRKMYLAASVTMQSGQLIEIVMSGSIWKKFFKTWIDPARSVSRWVSNGTKFRTSYGTAIKNTTQTSKSWSSD